MKRVILLILTLLLATTSVRAHHNAISSSSNSAHHVLASGVIDTKPKSQAYLIYDGAHLDNGVGNLHTSLVGGEWAFAKRASFMASVPVVFLDHNFAGENAGLGDVNLGGKILVLNNARWMSFAQAGLIFPTGNDNTGLGTGKFAGEFTFFGGFKMQEWLIFAAPAVSSAFDTQPEPTVTGSVGVASPTYFTRLFFSLSLTPQIFAQSTVLNDGSFKIYAEPQVGIFIDKRRQLSTSLAARVAVIDDLSRETGVTLTQTDHALQSDVLWSLKFVVNYSFN